MRQDKTQAEITAAENKSIGFDYQYYFFLLQLLRLRPDQSIGLEVKDDVHIELAEGKLILIQLKHTTQDKADGTKINLTERDIDLWKTIHNWVLMIKDPIENRQKAAAQLAFIRSTEFHLVTNKEVSQRNTFLKKCIELNDKKITIGDYKKYLNNLHDETADNHENKNLKPYIKDLKNLSDNLLIAFISAINLKLDEDDLINKIHVELASFMIPPERIDDVYIALNSRLRDSIYLNTKSKIKTFISHEDFLNKYRVCFTVNTPLPIRRIDSILPDNLISQLFIQQLLEIGDITSKDEEEILLFTKQKLLMFNNLNTWIQKSELTEKQKRSFISVCIATWKNEFRAAHRNNKRVFDSGNMPSEEDIKEAGLICLDNLRREQLQIETQNLDKEISNGQFYLLSDDLNIGWHFEWKKKYKK
jgi:hypothetical protein